MIEGLDQLNQLEQELLDSVPESDSIGNMALLQRLKWDYEQYWSIRNRLIDKGRLEKGRGKGGSVKRINFSSHLEKEKEKALENSHQDKCQETRKSEAELYEPLVNVIKNDWVRDHQIDSSLAEITARQGTRDTGGKWSRPDITLASYTTYAYVPGKHFDVVTFEIKPADAIDVTAVYEALAHRRAATRSYVILHVPDELSDFMETPINDICEEAKRHGIGVIVVGEPENYESWEERVEANRHEPDPAKLNNFLSKQVSQAFKEQINRWFR